MSLLADDAQRLETAHRFFQKLISEPDLPHTKRDLFGEWFREWWTRPFIDRCLALGLVTRERSLNTTGRGGAPYFYKAVPGADLRIYIEDAALLSALIWPQPSLPYEEVDNEPPSENTESVERAPSFADAVDAIKLIENTALAEDNVTLEETIRATLKISYAVLQNVTHMREKLDSMETALAQLQEAWK